MFDAIADLIGNTDGWTKRVPRLVLLAMLRKLQAEAEARERERIAVWFENNVMPVKKARALAATIRRCDKGE